MSTNSTYSCKVSEDILIENGIMKGVDVKYKFDYNSFGEMILERLKANPAFVGQVDGVTGRQETFAEMMDKSVKCSLWMKEQNIEAGDKVGICTHNQMDMYIPCFASLFIGAVYNPWWEAGLTKEVAKYFIELTKPKMLFLTDATAELVLEVIEEIGAKVSIVIFGESSKYLSLNSVLKTQDSNKVTDFRCTKLSSLEEPVIILYTSGSTGLPKGVVHSNKSLFANMYNYIELENVENTVTLLFSPLSWLSGAYTMLRGITVPDRRIIHPEYTPETCLELVEKFKINWLLLGPTAAVALEKCSAVSKYNVSSLQSILIGGSFISKETQMTLMEYFPNAFIFQGYGSTELGGAGIVQKKGFKMGSMGRIMKNQQLKVIDPETGRILNPNETGEVCFKNEYMMIGYYNSAEATKETIDSEGWLHTGDLAYYDEDGYVFFVDRLKELIKYKGLHVSPTMIENVVNKHPAIKEAAVVSILHNDDGEHPIAFVEKNSGFQITEEEIQKMVSDVLPDYMKLRGGVKFLHNMPHTSSGKIARKELKILAKSYIQ